MEVPLAGGVTLLQINKLVGCLMPSSDASLDDMSSTASSYDSDEEYRLAQQEWEESLHQLQQLVATVLLPIFGKWMGRRWSYLGSFTLKITTMPS
jgi:hypothetical protein